MEPLFDAEFLAGYLADFSLNAIPNLRNIKMILSDWVEELDMGKIDSMKEEAIKSRFLMSFFGDILGFNYGNAGKWMLEEERKTEVDGTKPDGVLGYFTKDEKQVIAVIEVKDARTSLDKKQKRVGDFRTPVEQAFSYAPKMGNTCKWVIVTNIKEIRFYQAGDQSKYQKYNLKDLIEEKTIKELLYIFHKDNFIKEESLSRTDLLLERYNKKKPKIIQDHIVDKIYDSLKRFEGFGFVEPNYIANIYPFNILDEYVWHYSHGELRTLNTEIYHLLKEINIKDNKINISKKLKQEAKKVADIEEKLKIIITILNSYGITCISAIKNYKEVEIRQDKPNVIGFSIKSFFNFNTDEGIRKDISLQYEKKDCDCLNCNYRNFLFDRLLKKLKQADCDEEYNTIEYAYGNYLVASNNFKKAYNISKKIESTLKGKEGKEVEYFLNKQNIKYLHNLIRSHSSEENIATILKNIRVIDLNKVIYDEIDISVDTEVKNYLIKVKENDLSEKIKAIIEDITLKNSTSINKFDDLLEYYNMFYKHIHRNYIFYNNFYEYKNITHFVFKEFVTHLKKNNRKSIPEFIIVEAILHIYSDNLLEILQNIQNLSIDDPKKLIVKLDNFLSSFFEKSAFGIYEKDITKEQLINYHFRQNIQQIFSGIFIILSKIDITTGLFQSCKKKLINYLSIESDLQWQNIESLSEFLLNKGNLFTPEELISILKIAIKNHEYNKTKYEKLIQNIPLVLSKFYPQYQFHNQKLTKEVLLKSTSDDEKQQDYYYLINLFCVSDKDCKALFLAAFESVLAGGIDESNMNLYEKMLKKEVYNRRQKKHFQSYIKLIEKNRKGFFHRLVSIIYMCDITMSNKELNLFTNLSDEELWALTPNSFDYDKFQPAWLIKYPFIAQKIKDKNKIIEIIHNELLNEFNLDLSTILTQITYLSNK